MGGKGGLVNMNSKQEKFQTLRDVPFLQLVCVWCAVDLFAKMIMEGLLGFFHYLFIDELMMF